MDIVSRTKLRDCYDEIALVVGDIKNHGFQHKYTRDLQMALNKFFDAKCIHVFFTQNTDKLPFGVFCMPKIPAEKVIEVITTSQRLVVTQYYLELDSKLFSETLNLTTDELTAVLRSAKKYALGTFLVQECTEGDEAYTDHFYNSNVIFA